MVKMNVDTTKIKNAGEEIVNYTSLFETDINSLKSRIDKMTTETFEWEGNAADTFVSNVDNQLTELNAVIKALYSYGNELVNIAQSYETAVRNSKLK